MYIIKKRLLSDCSELTQAVELLI